MFRPCVLIPVYNHEHAIGSVVARSLKYKVPCILVDDGSSKACAAVLDTVASNYPSDIVLLRHEKNQGKGAACLTGVQYAAQAKYSHVLQIDADGQHATEDIPKFLEAAFANPLAVITGYPIYDENIPALRFYGRYFTHVWVWINTLSLEIKDSMCGFRVYPVSHVIQLAQRQSVERRMAFDTDVIVRLFWEGVDIINLPTRVNYPVDGISHFRVWNDNLQISRMHAKLFFGMLARMPKLLRRR